jgi:hypothetical protein
MTAIKDDEKQVQDLKSDSARDLFTVLSVLAWAIFPAAVFSGLLVLSYFGNDSGLLSLVVLLIFMLPAGWICEAFGLGTFNLFSQMPGAMWPIMITLAYIYGLILVLVIRGFRRLISSKGRRIGVSA